MNTMTPEVQAALEALALAVLVGLTGLAGYGFRLLQKYLSTLEAKLDHNTRKTEQVQQQTNGRLRGLEDALAAERDKVIGLIGSLRNYRDLVAYLQANHPEIGPTLVRWRDRRTAPVRAEDLEALAARLADEPVTEARP